MSQGSGDVKSQRKTRVRLPLAEECQELFEPAGVQERGMYIQDLKIELLKI